MLLLLYLRFDRIPKLNKINDSRLKNFNAELDVAFITRQSLIRSKNAYYQKRNQKT